MTVRRRPRDGQDGKDGKDAFLLDIDNEIQAIPCHYSGTPANANGQLATATATVYRGASADTGWEFSKSDDGCASTIDAETGFVKVTAINADRASVTVTASKGGQSLTAVLTLYKVKPGTPGQSPVVYSIGCSASAISRAQDGTLTPATLTLTKNKTVGNSTTATPEKTLRYLAEGGESEIERTIAGTGGTVGAAQYPLDPTASAIIATLYGADGAVLDRERIPIVSDGKDGKDGEDACLLDLDNETQGIPCDCDGNPSAPQGSILASTGFTVYKGRTDDGGNGWTYSKTDSGCESSISQSARRIDVTSIGGDRASVTVSATKDGRTLTAVMSLYKVKAGGPGQDAVVYSIECSAAAMSRKADGTLTPQFLSAYKRKTAGQQTERTAEKTLMCKRVGQDSAAYVLAGNGAVAGGEIQGIGVDCTAIELTLKDGSDVLDSETVPIVKDGQDGKDAWEVSLSRQEIVFREGTAATETVEVRVKRGGTDIDYNNVGGGFACSIQTVPQGVGVTCTGNPGSGNKSFVYSVAYDGRAGAFSKTLTATITLPDGTQRKRDIHISSVANGEQGAQGVQGCIYRVTEWQAGKEYRNDSGATGDGLKYIDVTLIKDTGHASGARAYRCKESHTSDEDNKPNSTKWEMLNDMAPIYTPLIVADNAVLTLLQSNQIVVMKEDKKTVNLAMGGGKYPLWCGAAKPADANFKVDDTGKATMNGAEVRGALIAGEQEKQRVEILPEQKAMKVYDSQGIEVNSFEGNSYHSLGALFDNAEYGVTFQTHGSDNIYGQSPTTYRWRGKYEISSGENGKEEDTFLILTNPVHTVGRATIKSSYYLKAEVAIGSSIANTSSGTGNYGDGDHKAEETVAIIKLWVTTYADEDLTRKLSSVQISEAIANKNIWTPSASISENYATNTTTKSGGYHVLEVHISLKAYKNKVGGNESTARIYWGKYNGGSSSGDAVDVNAKYFEESYASRFFANGFCLGRSQSQYAMLYEQSQTTGGSGMRLTMKNGGFGFDFSEKGWKHAVPGGDLWLGTPMLLYKARYGHLGNNTYSKTAVKTISGEMPMTRTGAGEVTLAFPSAWKTGLGLVADNVESNVIVNVTAYGDDARFAVVKNVAVNGITVNLYDKNGSKVDGSFMISVFYVP